MQGSEIFVLELILLCCSIFLQFENPSYDPSWKLLDKKLSMWTVRAISMNILTRNLVTGGFHIMSELPGSYFVSWRERSTFGPLVPSTGVCIKSLNVTQAFLWLAGTQLVEMSLRPPKGYICCKWETETGARHQIQFSTFRLNGSSLGVFVFL